MELGEKIDLVANSFPKKEIYNLASQLRRAVDSVALNISEGLILQSNFRMQKISGICYTFLSRSGDKFI